MCNEKSSSDLPSEGDAQDLRVKRLMRVCKTEKLRRRELTAGAPAQRRGGVSLAEFRGQRDILSASGMMISQRSVTFTLRVKSPHCLTYQNLVKNIPTQS